MSTYVTLSSSYVKTLTGDVLRRIQGFRTVSERDFIEKAVQKRNSGFWHKLLRRPDYTYEQVLEIEYQLMVNGSIVQMATSGLRWAREAFEGQEDLADRLALAADHAPEVNVTAMDLEYLLSIPPHSVCFPDEEED